MADSIIKPEYRQAMKDRDPDWLRNFINKQVKDEDGKLDLDSLFQLAKVNGADAAKLSNLRKQRTDGSHYAARMSMTIRNMLQKIAAARHGLWDLKDPAKFHKADSEFLTKIEAPEAPTHRRDGTPIEQKKAA